MKQKYTAHVVANGASTHTFTFTWTWPSGASMNRVLSVNSVIPRWVNLPDFPPHAGTAYAQTTAFEITADPGGTVTIQMTYPFESSPYRWNVTA